MMRFRAGLLSIALYAGACDSSASSLLNTDGGVTFDPCAPNPSHGFDPNSQNLPKCCDVGPAHCVPASIVPAQVAPGLSPCQVNGGNGLCLPDEAISVGADFKPKSCTGIGNQKGICLSLCIAKVANDPQEPLLGQDVCESWQVCVPCINPVTKMSTGACEALIPHCGDGGTGTDDMGPAMCPYVGPPIIDPNSLDPCAPACMGAHCLQATLVPAAQQSILTACTAKNNMPGLCVPDPLIATGGNFVPKSCTSIAGAEGRCLSTCLPQIAAQAAQLPLDVCAAGEKCAPCFNPIASDPTAPTGACTLACDKPAQPPVMLMCPWKGPPVTDPNSFPACAPACAGAHCVPTANVPVAEQSLLAQCSGGFCVPDALIATGGKFVPKTCKSVAGVEGRCLSTCLPPIQAEAAALPKDVCADGEKCAPCYNPTATDPKAPTGACSIGCDKPANPPTLLTCPWTGPAVVDPNAFPACSPACNGAHCLPSALVPSSEQSLLSTCPGGFCVPDPLIATGGKWIPYTCTSIAGAEGRCLSTCLAPIAAQAAELPQDVCPSGEKCAPCYNPTAMDPTAPTGACTIGCDMPKKPPTILMCPYPANSPPVIDPNSFPACSPACSGAHCLPTALVPASQQAMLATCGSGASAGYCVPDPIIASDNHYVPPTCTSIAGAEGRCISTCLPAIAAQAAELPQANCPSGTKCAPCYNPTATDPTAPTGACSLGCDKPAKPPTVLTCPWTGPAVVDPNAFPQCSPSCAGSHCLPKALVPPSQQAMLAPCGSGATAGFCTPDFVIQSDNHSVPKSCTSIAGAEGRCLSTCLPAIAAEAELLPTSVCGANEKCAPCYNPTATDPTAPTGACSLGCDKPAKPPTVITCPWMGPAVVDPAQLPACDGGCAGAHCLPSSVVPPAEAGMLATCGSGASAGYCTPDPFITGGGKSVPPGCAPFAGQGEGRCLSACIPQIGAQASQLQQVSCGTNELCAPCSDPFTGASTGACTTACDMPAQPVYTFPPCCVPSNPGATCVPTYEIPSSQASNLNQDVCPASFKCVPDEYLPAPHTSGTIETCTTTFGFSGACVNTCAVSGVPGFLTSNTCSGANHVCVNCTFTGLFGKAPPGC